MKVNLVSSFFNIATSTDNPAPGKLPVAVASRLSATSMMVAWYDIRKIELMKNFTLKKLSHISALAALCATIFSGSVFAGPAVRGNVISWTDEGWHQVQGTYESLCQGGRQCTVPTGVYIVINHSTGERFENIPVGEQEGDSAPAAVAATGQVISYGFGDDGDYQSGQW